MNIAVMGSGGWGLAMAKCMAEKGHSVAVWSHKPETTAMLRRDRCNPKLLRGVTLPAGTPIAIMGNTGQSRGSTGVHLHFMLTKGAMDSLGLCKGFDPRKLLAPGTEAIKAKVKEKMELFGSVGKA